MKTKGVSAVAFGTRCCLPAHGRQTEPIDFTRVKIQDAFWGPRLATNRRVTIPHDFKWSVQ